MIVPLFVGREKSVKALEEVMKDDKQILLIAQKNASQDDPGAEDIYTIGTLGTVLQLLKLPDDTVKVLVKGGRRVRIDGYTDRSEFFEARAVEMEESAGDPAELQAAARTVVSEFENYVKLNKKVPPEVVVSINKIEEPAKLADVISAHLALKVAEKQQLLELDSVSKRLERILGLMEGEIGVLQVEKKIRNRVKRQMEKTQREYYLNEQMKAIQKELGETEDGRDEVSELEKRIKKTRLSKEAREKAHAELEKIKERILEYLAVQQRVDKMKGPILCLVGPPGVGKTSLGKSIAKATGRNFVRMSLGGVRDEAEIRGHRRTYIGSLPGKVIQSMKKAKSSNPLFLLDEIDKLGADFRGDPSSALLEVLDPEQNAAFNDHYLEVDYDLSNVMFITTANSLRMAQPLMDRMEIIRLAGYTEDEKIAIARKHLIAKQIEANGLKEGELDIHDDAVRDIVRYYTREAGVRNLEREIVMDDELTF